MSESRLHLEVIAQLAKAFDEAFELANPGALLYSSERSSGQLLLLRTGSIRLIDQGRAF